MRRALLLLAILPAFGSSAADRIGTIDFYGYGSLDLASLRNSLPFREGDAIPSRAVQGKAQEAVSRIAGRKAVVSDACCLPDGRSTMFLGIAESGAPPVVYNPIPQGDIELPPQARKILRQLDKHLFSAVRRGAANEDHSQGYALNDDPSMRADELKLRTWSQAHTAIVLRVLAESSHSGQRANAARALGYADRAPEQIAAMVAAAFDSDEDVRNNAVRALMVLCAVGSEVTRQIPAARFVPLLHSLEWTDRNKSANLFARLTESRDPSLLQMLREQAIEPLREMAQWKDVGHASASVIILGRMAGVEESRLEKADATLVDEVLRATR
ncbi:MAG: HEAT repeat domain-containing protein [Ignavibacteriota bacterium]